MVAIRRHFPEARITLLTNESESDAPDARKILEGNEFLNEIISYRPSMLYQPSYFFRLARKLRSMKYDFVVYLPLSATSHWRLFRDRVFFVFFVSRKSIGFVFPKPNGKVTINGNEIPYYQNETDRLLEVVRLADVIAYPVEYRLPIRAADVEFVDNIMREYRLGANDKIVAVSPASKFQSKTWPLENYVKVINQLISLYGIKVLLIGGINEIDSGKYLEEKCGVDVVNLISKTNFMQSAEALSRCRLLLANDCGPVHLAAAVGVPVVGIYASVHYPGAWHPWGSIHTVHRNDDVSCRFCFKSECSHKSCINSISPQDVIVSCAKYLAEQGKKIGVALPWKVS
jgi:heptosyltransferase II